MIMGTENAPAPTPWEIRTGGTYYYPLSIAGADGREVACFHTFDDKRRANVEFIVKAVNNHEALVAALTSARGVLATITPALVPHMRLKQEELRWIDILLETLK
jgi:hypothetical protein